MSIYDRDWYKEHRNGDIKDCIYNPREFRHDRSPRDATHIKPQHSCVSAGSRKLIVGLCVAAVLFAAGPFVLFGMVVITENRFEMAAQTSASVFRFAYKPWLFELSSENPYKKLYSKFTKVLCDLNPGVCLLE